MIFRNGIKYFNEITQITGRLINACKALEVPILATEQYPKGYLLFKQLQLYHFWNYQKFVSSFSDFSISVFKLKNHYALCIYF